MTLKENGGNQIPLPTPQKLQITQSKYIKEDTRAT